MGYRTKVLGSKRVDISQGYWVKIRALDGAENQLAQEALLGGPIESTLDGADLKTQRHTFHQNDYIATLFSLAILDWSLDDESGQVLPITHETVLGLSAADQVTVLREIQKLNNPLREPAAQQG